MGAAPHMARNRQQESGGQHPGSWCRQARCAARGPLQTVPTPCRARGKTGPGSVDPSCPCLKAQSFSSSEPSGSARCRAASSSPHTGSGCGPEASLRAELVAGEPLLCLTNTHPRCHCAAGPLPNIWWVACGGVLGPYAARTSVTSFYFWATSVLLSSTGLFLVAKPQLSGCCSFTWTCHTACNFWDLDMKHLCLEHSLPWPCLAAFYLSPKNLIKSHLPRVPLLYALQALYSFLPSHILAAAKSLISLVIYLVFPIRTHLLLCSTGSAMLGTW